MAVALAEAVEVSVQRPRKRWGLGKVFKERKPIYIYIRGGLLRGHDNPIHGSCSIYFPGGILFNPK